MFGRLSRPLYNVALWTRRPGMIIPRFYTPTSWKNGFIVMYKYKGLYCYYSWGIGESTEDACDLLKEKLGISSVATVEDLDNEYSGLVSFAIGRSSKFLYVTSIIICNVIVLKCTERLQDESHLRGWELKSAYICSEKRIFFSLNAIHWRKPPGAVIADRKYRPRYGRDSFLSHFHPRHQNQAIYANASNEGTDRPPLFARLWRDDPSEGHGNIPEEGDSKSCVNHSSFCRTQRTLRFTRIFSHVHWYGVRLAIGISFLGTFTIWSSFTTMLRRGSCLMRPLCWNISPLPTSRITVVLILVIHNENSISSCIANTTSPRTRKSSSSNASSNIKSVTWGEGMIIPHRLNRWMDWR